MRKHRDTVARGRYAFAGGAFLMMVFGVLAGVAGGGWFLWNPETPRWILWVCGGCLVGSALGGLIVLATARGVTCPLCRASLFTGSRNLVKPGVRKFFGNAKIPIAFSLLFRASHLNCPYCRESVRLKGEKR